MAEKSKLKKGKRLPSHIQFSIILWYFIITIVFSLMGAFLSEMIGDRISSVMMFVFMVVAPLTGFVVGWAIKFRYVRQSGDESQKLRIKAQF